MNVALDLDTEEIDTALDRYFTTETRSTRRTVLMRLVVLAAVSSTKKHVTSKSTNAVLRASVVIALYQSRLMPVLPLAFPSTTVKIRFPCSPTTRCSLIGGPPAPSISAVPVQLELIA
jgi:hypothetical protein